MKILVIGSNGREHALTLAYAKSKKVTTVFVSPGNGLTQDAHVKIVNVPIEMADLQKLLKFAKTAKINLVDVAQDDCLSKGYVDAFKKENITVFGPSKAASEIEWNKEWARSFMKKYKLPIPKYESFSDVLKAEKYAKSIKNFPVFVKASGLALGKGVIKCKNASEVLSAISEMAAFGHAGKTFLIEEGLVGEEFSLFVISDSNKYCVLKAAQDHKTVYENDKGSNTGGIGSISPTNAVSKKDISEIEKKILSPFFKAMREEKREYSGILYLGGIKTAKGIKIIEFNARWGDPEAEVILPGITSDYFDLAYAVAQGKLKKGLLKMDRKIRICVTACASGYPKDISLVKGKEIFGIKEVQKMEHIELYGSGITKKQNKYVVNGGRIFHVVSVGQTVEEARAQAYQAMSHIFIEGNLLHFRTDIGWRDIERKFKK